MGLQPRGLVLGELGLEALHLPAQLPVHRPQRLQRDTTQMKDFRVVRSTPHDEGLELESDHSNTVSKRYWHASRWCQSGQRQDVKERVPRPEGHAWSHADSLSIGGLRRPTFMRCASASFSCVSRMTAVSMVCSFLCASSYDFLAARVAATATQGGIPHNIHMNLQARSTHHSYTRL